MRKNAETIILKDNKLYWQLTRPGQKLEATVDVTPIYWLCKELFKNKPELLEGDTDLEWIN